jgi:hypothetical protein
MDNIDKILRIRFDSPGCAIQSAAKFCHWLGHEVVSSPNP